MGDTVDVTDLRPAASGDAGQWLLRPDVDWWDLVRYGPPGFDAYVRIAFAEVAAEGEDPVVRLALATLAAHTTTPDAGYAGIWEGGTGGPPDPRAPQVPIPNRTMLMYTGSVDVLRDAPALARFEPGDQWYQEPNLVWPEDHAWCLACEVDEEIEFSVGCSDDAARALAEALPGAVRRVHYGEPAPLYRDRA